MALLLGYRFLYLGGPLDEPSWRQAWCAYQARQLARESPPELMRVKINFRGTNDVSFWNFPVYEGVVGLAYKATGGEERLWLARIITLLMYLGATWCLGRIVSLLLGARTAWYTALVYMILPLGIFYSRAVHYDIGAIFLSHAFFLAALSYCERPRMPLYITAALLGVLAFAVKPPYAAYFAIPIGFYALTAPDERRWRTLIEVGTMFLFALIATWALHEYRLSIESGHASKLLYPVPYTKGYARSWFLGHWGQRFSLAAWTGVARDVVKFVLTPVGALLAAYAALFGFQPFKRRGWFVLYGWLAGMAGYILVMFRMLSSVGHTYYLLPLLAPAAVAIGSFLASEEKSMAREAKGWWRNPLRVLLVMTVLAAGSFRALRRGNFFVVDWQRVQAGAAIKQWTNPSDLVVSSTLGRSTGSVDPRILYFSDRRGWVIAYKDLTQEALRAYREAGASFVALLVTPEYSDNPGEYSILLDSSCRVIKLLNPSGVSIGSLLLFRLADEELASQGESFVGEYQHMGVLP